jgi:hypothetical protein
MTDKTKQRIQELVPEVRVGNNMKSLKDIYTGKIYADEEVLKGAPRSEKKAKLQFFKIGRYVSCAELEREYASRSLVPADPYTLAEYMETHQNDDLRATQWKDADGDYCYATFYRWRGERYVGVGRDGGWRGFWSFAGVPQVSSALKPSEKHLDALPLELEINGFTYRRV